jgi:lipid II:glycine glycyltransferase (peptidoglycan interpeptide bridge formation enzyme)
MFRPFLQSWAMGEVYRKIGQEPVRLILKDGQKTVGICFGHVVSARRGRHLSIPYGPIIAKQNVGKSLQEIFTMLIDALRKTALQHRCAFLRISTFWPQNDNLTTLLKNAGATPSPLHLLAEHLWYLPLRTPDPWLNPLPQIAPLSTACTPENLFANFRSTTRNLIRRAEKEGVTIERSKNPESDLQFFLALHEETRKRHGFTPYTDTFFRAQMCEFSLASNASLYLARYQGEVIASSMHMHMGGETSYHHGASTHRFSKIPASYLLQWTAIQDALKRGDHVYNFWGIAPQNHPNTPHQRITYSKHHPFAGVTLFKTGFGGSLLTLTHCQDIPLSPLYHVTRSIEVLRRWKRGF